MYFTSLAIVLVEVLKANQLKLNLPPRALTTSLLQYKCQQYSRDQDDNQAILGHDKLTSATVMHNTIEKGNIYLLCCAMAFHTSKEQATVLCHQHISNIKPHPFPSFVWTLDTFTLYSHHHVAVSQPSQAPCQCSQAGAFSPAPAHLTPRGQRAGCVSFLHSVAGGATSDDLGHVPAWA